MSTMSCNQFLDQLDVWMEGKQSSAAMAHARDCGPCRSIIEDFDAIYQSAQSMSAEDLDPPEHVWISLRERLVREGLIRGTRSEGWKVKLRRLFEGDFTSAPRPALAGAYLVALVAVGFALSGSFHRQAATAGDAAWTGNASTQPLSAKLDSAEQDIISSMADSSPVVTASLHKNLGIVDNYIALCEKSVHEEPQSEMARDYLYQAYQQKADLIAEMNERDGR